jgi:hypothetical protein
LKIKFSQNLFNDDANNVALKQQLEDFFNREDVHKKLSAVAKHVFTSGVTVADSNYGMSAVALSAFGSEKETDGDPHNLAGAVIQAFAVAKDDRDIERSVVAGLKNCTAELIGVVQRAQDCSLKSLIIGHAKSSQLIIDKGVA